MKFKNKKELSIENVNKNEIYKNNEEPENKSVVLDNNDKNQKEVKPILKNKSKIKKVVLACISTITVIALVLGGAFAILMNQEDPFEDLKRPTEFDDINEDIVAKTDLDNFYYQFATVSNENNDPTIHLNGTTDIENEEGDLEMVDTKLSYDVTDEQYELIKDLEIKVDEEIKVDKNDNATSLFFFENDFDSLPEQESTQIKQLIRDIAKTTPESVANMTYDEKVDYIIDYTRNQADNFILSEFIPLGRLRNFVEYNYSLYNYKGTKTDSKYDYVKVTYRITQSVPYDKTMGEDPAMVDGVYKYNPEINMMMRIDKAEDVSLTRDEVLNILAKHKQFEHIKTFEYNSSRVFHEKTAKYCDINKIREKAKKEYESDLSK